MSTKLAKVLLGIFTTFFPVFIAACYGTGFEDDDDMDASNGSSSLYGGTVIDSVTRVGIPDIKVSCLSSSLLEVASTYTAPGDGAFELREPFDSPCSQLRFEDLDGPANGGQYQMSALDVHEPYTGLTVGLVLETDTDSDTDGDAGPDAN